MRRSLLVVMAFSVLAGPLWADILPSRRVDKTSDVNSVGARAGVIGATVDEVERRINVLTVEDCAFFAAAPNRVQVVGAQDMFSGQGDPLWYEWVGGLGFGLAGLAVLVHAITNNEK